MSFSKSLPSLPQRFLLVVASFLQKPGLPFGDVLSEEKMQAAFEAEDANFAQEEEQVYSPQVTLWAFLSQVLFKGEQRSCQAAVDRVATFMAAFGKVVSGNTGAYCRARAKLPEAVVHRLTLDSAEGCEKALPQEWLWLGHHVYLADGSTASMPDTLDNQDEWPQHGAQQEGLGFPILRFVVLLSLATAMLRGMALGKYMGKETGETALLRELFDQLSAGDVLLADRYYCSYFMVALLLELGVNVVMRLHQQRPADFRRGRRLGKADHVVHWTRPAQPEWMDDETYARMPESIEVREVEVHVDQPGFRTESLVVITTLTDPERYTKDDLAELYRQRWLAELDIRAIKITMGMDVLRCQTPHMVRREIWTCLFAYNFIRQTMLASAQGSRRSPRELSSYLASSRTITRGGWSSSPSARPTRCALCHGSSLTARFPSSAPVAVLLGFPVHEQTTLPQHNEQQVRRVLIHTRTSRAVRCEARIEGSRSSL